MLKVWNSFHFAARDVLLTDDFQTVSRMKRRDILL